MNSRLTELSEIALLKAIERLLKLNKSGQVTWCHIVRNGKTEDITEEDVEEVIEALSHDDFQENFTISIFNNSALVGWKIDEKKNMT